MPTQITGVINRIVSYSDGTSQVEIATLSGDIRGYSFPFYRHLHRPENYLGKVVDLSEREKQGGVLFQLLHGSDFTRVATISRARREAIRQNGRVQIAEFALQ